MDQVDALINLAVILLWQSLAISVPFGSWNVQTPYAVL
jgi:hypothetical protein